MVLTVEVELCSYVFFPGDPLYCRIIVTNSLNPKESDILDNTDGSSHDSTPSNTPTKSSLQKQANISPRGSVNSDQQSGEDIEQKTELLSWVSLQVHGNMLVDPLYVKVSNLPSASSKAHAPRTALAVGSISSANMASTSLPNLSDLGMSSYF